MTIELARVARGSGDDDFDLVLVTHMNVIVIELKDWHGKKLEAVNGHWYVDGEDRGASPVERVNLKAKKLVSLMRKKLDDDKTPLALMCRKPQALRRGACLGRGSPFHS